MFVKVIFGVLACAPSRPVTSLGHQEGRRGFWEGPKFFELCPIVSSDVQHIFPGGAKNFWGGEAPLATGLSPSPRRSNSKCVEGRNKEGKGGTIPRAPNHYGGAQSLPRAPNNSRGAEKSQQCCKYFLQYSTFASKDLRFKHGSTKVASCPGDHRTLLHPWVRSQDLANEH